MPPNSVPSFKGLKTCTLPTKSLVTAFVEKGIEDGVNNIYFELNDILQDESQLNLPQKIEDLIEQTALVL